MPENFNEISGKQFIGLAPLLFNGGDELSCKIKALRVLCGLSVFRFRMLKAETIDTLLQYVNWVFEPANITKQLLPFHKNYYGPASGFDNLLMKEFHVSEQCYKQFIGKDGSDEDLHQLIAVLYRLGKNGYDKKRDPDGDIRREFNHNELAYHAKKISRWPDVVKQAVFIWYDGCRQELIDCNPMVFKVPSKHSFESAFDTGLYGMIRSLAGEKLGPIEKVENMHVHHALLELGLLKEEERYLDEQMEAAKK